MGITICVTNKVILDEGEGEHVRRCLFGMRGGLLEVCVGRGGEMEMCLGETKINRRKMELST